MKIYTIFFLLLSTFMLIAEKPVSEQQRREKKLMQTLSALPHEIVVFNKHKITKSDVTKMILQQHPDFEDYSFDELQDAFRQVIDEEIYYTLCADFLKKNGFTPSRQKTYQYLRDAINKFPAELKKMKYKNKTLQTLAADRNTQLSTALHLYLKKNKPDAINVSNEEVEYFYRVNQNIFMHDAKIDISFIAAAKSDPDAFFILKDAYSMLRQGVKFSKLAEKINTKLPKDFFKKDSFPPEMIARAANMPLNEPSHIIEFPDYYAIIMVSQKVPPKYIPLDKADFFIRNELESRKSGIYLEQMLNDLLKNTTIKRNAFQ